MTTHLDDHGITAAVAGLELEAAAAEHLRSCLSCRQQVTAMQDLIDGRRQDFEDESPDWERQRPMTRRDSLRIRAARWGGSSRLNFPFDLRVSATAAFGKYPRFLEGIENKLPAPAAPPPRPTNAK